MSSSTVYNNAVRGSCMFITICIWLWAFCCYLFGGSYLEESLNHRLLAELLLCVYSIGGLLSRLEKFSPIPRSASFPGDALPWYCKLWRCVFLSWGAVTWRGLYRFGTFSFRVVYFSVLGERVRSRVFSFEFVWDIVSCHNLRYVYGGGALRWY